MNQPIKKAIVLSSGGLDSTTVMAIAADRGYLLYSISFDYGQRHLFELDRAKEIAKHYKVKEHLILKVDLQSIGGSALTSNIDVPKDSLDTNKENIPVTYVPARNSIFLSMAVAWGEVIGAYDIFIGVNAIDYSGYPDCREDFISAFEKMVSVGTKAGVEGKKITIHTPLIKMNKKEIIETGLKLGVDYSMTTSCYDPSPAGKPCGSCDACILRKRGFNELGLEDPALR